VKHFEDEKCYISAKHCEKVGKGNCGLTGSWNTASKFLICY